MQFQPREIIALDRQGTQQQRRESPTVTPPGVYVNTKCINSTKGTSSRKDAPSGMYTPPFQTHSGTKVYTGIRQNQFVFDTGHSA